MKKALYLYIFTGFILCLLASTVPQYSMPTQWHSFLYILLFIFVLVLVAYINAKCLKLPWPVILTLTEWFICSILIHKAHLLFQIRQLWHHCNVNIMIIALVLSVSLAISLVISILMSGYRSVSK